MYLIYTDEAGNTGSFKDPNQPIHMIGALLVEDDKVEPLRRNVETIIARRFHDIYLQDGFELHGNAVFGGSGLFRSVSPIERLAACDEIFDLLIADEVPIIWTAVDKLNNLSSDHPHAIAFRCLAERIERFLRGKDSLGLIVADENKEMEQKVIDDLVRYKRIGSGQDHRRMQITKIIDSVHFVQSKNNAGIQTVDLVTYFLNKALRTRREMEAAWLACGDGRSYPEYRAANPLKPAMQAVLDLNDKLQLCVTDTELL